MVDEEKESIFECMIMSDLHLEYSDTIIPEFDVIAPILILAGDIGRPDIQSLQNFLLEQCQRFEHIFYVAGNHCFYDGIYEKRLEQLEELNNLHPRIHFLQCQTYLLPNRVRILGTTLWSNIPQQSSQIISQSLIDYRCISTIDQNNQNVRSITINDTNQWHFKEHQWLKEEIEKARQNNEHIIIITHHSPSRENTCLEEDKQAGLEDAYVNDHHQDCTDPVRVWIYGHTHKSMDFFVNSTRIFSNQLGCRGEFCGFRNNLKLTLFNGGSTKINHLL